jgi:thiamine-phosphate pyrophosphorylase
LRAFEGAHPVLCLVTNRGASRFPLEEAVYAALTAGTDWIQIRERELEGRELLRLAERIVELARRASEESGRRTRVLVNRRIDVALAAGADGVHLGGDALPVAAARALLPEGALIGVSTHATSEVRSAARAGASYAHLAPIFSPLSKAPSRTPLGLGALSEARDAGIAVLAQGGIDEVKAAEVVRAGAAGIAVTGGILAAPDPARAAAALRRALDGVDAPSRASP